MNWQIAIIGAAVLAVAGVSRRLTGTPVTPAMAFVLIGALAGPLIIDGETPSPTGSFVRTLAEATLTIVLFGDASRIKLDALKREFSVPLRLLGIGLPLTIILGAVLAVLMFNGLNAIEALVLAIVLAPTDAALGEAVVTEPRLPSRIRQGLNVESGLNDGICVPLLLIALAVAQADENAITASHAARIVVEEIGYGMLGGAVAGIATSAIAVIGDHRRLISDSWLQVVPVGGAILAYGIAVALGGSGFIAAFVAGVVFGRLAPTASEEASRFSEELGSLLGGVTFVVFGAVLLGPDLKHLDWEILLYAILSLTLIRMLPVAISMIGTRAKLPTLAFLGWFGPRGLASIVFTVIVVEEARLPGLDTILVTAYMTVGLSVFAHGISASPLARRYASWYESRTRESAAMERVPAAEHRARGPRHSPTPLR